MMTERVHTGLRDAPSTQAQLIRDLRGDDARPLLIDQDQSRTTYNPFDSGHRYNFTLHANTSEYAVTFGLDLCLEQLIEGGRASIIDPHGEFVEQARIAGARIEALADDAPQSLNLLWGIAECEINDPRRVHVLSDWIGLLIDCGAQVAYSQKPGVERGIERALKDSWATAGQTLGLAEVHAALEKAEDSELQAAADALAPYAVGDKAGWFNGRPIRDRKNDFIVFDTSALSTGTPLTAAIHFSLYLQYYREAWTQFFKHRLFSVLLFSDADWALAGVCDDCISMRGLEIVLRLIRQAAGAIGFVGVTPRLLETELNGELEYVDCAIKIQNDKTVDVMRLEGVKHYRYVLDKLDTRHTGARS